jgi:predicted secreted protein
MAVNGSDQVSIGKIVVTGVDSLLLTTDTVATAKFRWQLDLNEIGQVITQSERPKKVGEVQFGKQPDGVWVITAINM